VSYTQQQQQHQQQQHQQQKQQQQQQQQQQQRTIHVLMSIIPCFLSVALYCKFLYMSVSVTQFTAVGSSKLSLRHDGWCLMSVL
jgi:cation transport ATPase